MPESFIPVWISLGEAQAALVAECEDCGTAILPEHLHEAIRNALEDERPRSLEAMNSIDRADQLRAEAADLRRRADAKTDEAEAVEREAGLYPPCHLCGRRECGH